MKKLIFTSLHLYIFTLIFAGDALAQYTKRVDTFPYGFVQLGAGTTTTFENGGVYAPNVALGIGAGISKDISARLSISGFTQQVKMASGTEHFNYFDVNADVLFNVINIFKAHYHGRFNPAIIAGVGYNNGWEYEKIDQDYDVFNGVNLHGGLLLDYILSDQWNIGLEGTVAMLDDDFNALRGKHNKDGMLNLRATLTFKF